MQDEKNQDNQNVSSEPENNPTSEESASNAMDNNNVNSETTDELEENPDTNENNDINESNDTSNTSNTELKALAPLTPESSSKYTSNPQNPTDKLNFSEQISSEEEINSNLVGKFSQVAASAGSKRFILIVFVFALLIGGYYAIKMIMANREAQYVEKSDANLQTRKEEILKQAKPIATQIDDTSVTKGAPKLPEPPPVQVPQAPDLPPTPVPNVPQAPLFPAAPGQTNPVLPGVSNTGIPTVGPGNSGIGAVALLDKQSEEERKRLEARRKAGIMVMGGSGGNNGQDAQGAEGKLDGKDKDKDKDKDKNKVEATKPKDTSGFLGFGDGALGGSSLSKTQATQVKATHIGRLDSMIAQGKIINAVLETAINSDLPGPLRAIISENVYAESGKAILVPAGSRVIGSYQSQVQAGQTRINVAWSRLIRPDGIDLAIDSPGTDALGRAGLTGFLDDKFLTQLTNAFLVSYIIPLATNKLVRAKNNSPVQQTTTNNATTNTSSTTTSSDFKTQQLQQSSEQFKDIATKAAQNAINTKPTIYIDQGYAFNIFVNKDLVFPPEVALNNMKVVK